MTIRELSDITRIHRIVIRGLHHTSKVIDLKGKPTIPNEYLKMQVDEIKPYIESKIDNDGELRAKGRIEVYIYE